MEFAIIHTGGKQYKVQAGDLVTIEKIVGEYKEGDKFPCPNPECTKIFTITGFTESVTVTFKGSSGSDNAFSDLAGLFPF